MRFLELECVGGANDELAHRPRAEQCLATLGMTKARQVDGHQMGVLGQTRPRRLEREQALRPRAQQESVIIPLLAFGEADRQPVDGPELRLHGRVRPDAQRTAPTCLGSNSLGERMAASVVCAEGARILQGTAPVASRRVAACLPGWRAQLERRCGARVAGQDAIELVARADVELDEDLAQVVLHSARTDEQAGADLGV